MASSRRSDANAMGIQVVQARKAINASEFLRAVQLQRANGEADVREDARRASKGRKQVVNEDGGVVFGGGGAGGDGGVHDVDGDSGRIESRDGSAVAKREAVVQRFHGGVAGGAVYVGDGVGAVSVDIDVAVSGEGFRGGAAEEVAFRTVVAVHVDSGGVDFVLRRTFLHSGSGIESGGVSNICGHVLAGDVFRFCSTPALF